MDGITTPAREGDELMAGNPKYERREFSYFLLNQKRDRSTAGIISNPFGAAVTRLCNWMRTRERLLQIHESWAVRERQELDCRILETARALGRARASKQRVVIPECPDADRLVSLIAAKVAAVPDPRELDLLPVAVAESLRDRTPDDDEAREVLAETDEED